MGILNAYIMLGSVLQPYSEKLRCLTIRYALFAGMFAGIPVEAASLRHQQRQTTSTFSLEDVSFIPLTTHIVALAIQVLRGSVK